MDQHSLQALADRLEQAQKTLVAAHGKATQGNDAEEIQMVDDTFRLGTRLALYLTLLVDGQTKDAAPLREVREFCNLIEDMRTAI